MRFAMSQQMPTHSACMDSFNAMYLETPTDEKIGVLLSFLKETCEFGSVAIELKIVADMKPECELTTFDLLHYLLHSDPKDLSGLSQFAFHEIPMLARCTPRSSDCLNVIALEDEQGTIAAYYLVANASTMHNFLLQVVYIPREDSLCIFFPVSYRGAYDELFQALRETLKRLPDNQDGRFFLDKAFRSKIVAQVKLRSKFAPYFWNGFNHLGHYFLNYLGPLSRYLGEGLLSFGGIFFLGGRPSWLGDIELSQIIPKMSGFNRVKDYAVFVASMRDAEVVCREMNLGMIALYGSCMTLSLSNSIAKCTDQTYISTECEALSIKQNALVIGVGLRGGTRMVVNLDELICKMGMLLSLDENTKLHFIFDGMCKSSNPEHPSTSLLSLDHEIKQAELIRSRLAERFISSESVVGLSLIEQLRKLSKCSAILTHSGSGSAKYLWALNKPTIVLNCPRTPGVLKYNSSLDPLCHDNLGFFFGRAFRGSCHSPEYYVSQSFLRLAEGDSTSLESRSNENKIIDVERGAVQILEYITEILGAPRE